MKLDEEILTALRELGPAVADLSMIYPGNDWRPVHELLDIMHGSLALPGRSAAVTIDRYNIPAEDGSLLPLRVYRRTDADPAAVVLYVHGAVMLDRDLDACDTMCRRYALEADVAVAAIGYRLAPEDAEVGPVEDCHAALLWLAEYAAELGFDPARIGIAGDSAGGALAAGTALLNRDRGGPELALQVLVYPMLDDRGHVPDPSLLPTALWAYEFNALAWKLLLGESADGPDVPAYWAPARATDLSGLPRTYLEVGELDILCDEILAYAARLSGAGVPVELHVRPGAPHGFDLFAPRSALGRQAVADRLKVLSSL